MDKLQKQFLIAYDELESEVYSRDESVAIGAAGPLRLLLAEVGAPLAQRVAGAFKRKLQIDACTAGSAPFPTPIRLAPSEAGADPVTPLPLKHFLALNLTTAGDRAAITVLDVIKYFAHVEGAVHVGSPSEPAESAIEAMRADADPSARNWPLAALRSVGRAVLESLTPMREEIRGVRKFEGAPGVTVMLDISVESMGGDRENVIADLGYERHRNRLTLLVDSDDRLCVRVYDRSGVRIILRSPPTPHAFDYTERFPMELSVGRSGSDGLVRLATDVWCGERVFGVETDWPGDFHKNVILGSDLSGSPSNFTCSEMIVRGIVVSAEDRATVFEYMGSRIVPDIVFRNGAFLHSRGHRAFHSAVHTDSRTPTELVQREPSKQPALRHR